MLFSPKSFHVLTSYADFLKPINVVLPSLENFISYQNCPFSMNLRLLGIFIGDKKKDEGIWEDQ